MRIVAKNKNIRALVEAFMENPVPVSHPDHINQWDVSRVTNMDFLFYNLEEFNEPIDAWDVSRVTTMRGMFHSASRFNQPLDAWNGRVGKVRDMTLMFHYAEEFNQPLENWDVSQVKSMKGMFRSAKSFNQPLNEWNVSNVTDMSYMFEGATNFNQPLDQWDVRNVEKMQYMFFMSGFDQEDPHWELPNLKNADYMFQGNPPFQVQNNATEEFEPTRYDEIVEDADYEKFKQTSNQLKELKHLQKVALQNISRYSSSDRGTLRPGKGHHALPDHLFHRMIGYTYPPEQVDEEENQDFLSDLHAYRARKGGRRTNRRKSHRKRRTNRRK